MAPSASSLPAPLTERLWAIGEKVAVGLLAFVGGLLVAWWRKRKQRARREAADRRRQLVLLEATAHAALVLLEEANHRDWSLSTGRFLTPSVDPRILQGQHREKRQQATTLLRAAVGQDERRRSTEAERADYARQLRLPGHTD